MSNNDYFWKASIEELKKGFFYNEKVQGLQCLLCGEIFEDGVIYPLDNKLYDAHKAIAIHIQNEHGSPFSYFLEMKKTYTGLTSHQKELMKMMFDGLKDKEILTKTDATNTSTIRNQRFSFREKYKQAKIIVAIHELLEDEQRKHKLLDKAIVSNNEDELVDIHRTATMVDDRYVITKSEKEDVLKLYFDDSNRLIKKLPVKEKKKIIILQHIMKAFEINKRYSEKEVNGVIADFYEDTVTIRRYLIDYGFMDRKKDGSEYWVKQ